MKAKTYFIDTTSPYCEQGAYRFSGMCGVTVGEALRAHLCSHGAEFIRPSSIGGEL